MSGDGGRRGAPRRPSLRGKIAGASAAAMLSGLSAPASVPGAAMTAWSVACAALVALGCLARHGNGRNPPRR